MYGLGRRHGTWDFFEEATHTNWKDFLSKTKTNVSSIKQELKGILQIGVEPTQIFQKHS